MTVAICLKCGVFKHGAWTPCPQCGYTPDDDESYTKHLLVTDHYLSSEELENISARIKAGEAIEFPPEVLQQAWVSKAEIDRTGRGCMIGCIVVVSAILAAIGGYFVWRG